MAPVNTIKFALGGDKRRVNLADLGGSISYARLCDVVMTAYGAEMLSQGFAFQYRDDEDELITLGSDNELDEALRLAGSLGRPSLQLQVFPELELGASASTTAGSVVDWEQDQADDESANASAHQENDNQDDQDEDARSEGSDDFFLVETASQTSISEVPQVQEQAVEEQIDGEVSPVQEQEDTDTTGEDALNLAAKEMALEDEQSAEQEECDELRDQEQDQEEEEERLFQEALVVEASLLAAEAEAKAEAEAIADSEAMAVAEAMEAAEEEAKLLLQKAGAQAKAEAQAMAAEEERVLLEEAEVARATAEAAMTARAIEEAEVARAVADAAAMAEAEAVVAAEEERVLLEEEAAMAIEFERSQAWDAAAAEAAIEAAAAEAEQVAEAERVAEAPSPFLYPDIDAEKTVKEEKTAKDEAAKKEEEPQQSTPPSPPAFSFPELAEGLMRHPVLQSLRSLLEMQQQQQHSGNSEQEPRATSEAEGAGGDDVETETDPLRDLVVLCTDPAVVRALQDAVASPALTPLLTNAASLYTQRPPAPVHEYMTLLQQAPALLPVLARVTTAVPDLVFSFPRIVAAVSELMRRANGAKGCCRSHKDDEEEEESSSDSCCSSSSSDPDEQSMSHGCKCDCKCCKGGKCKCKCNKKDEDGKKKPVHVGVQCDGCDGKFDSNHASHIVGVRYKSAVKEDFDLCETCEASGEWDESHGPFLKIVRPSMAPVGLLCVLKDGPSANAAAADEEDENRRPHRHHRHHGHHGRGGHHGHHGRGGHHGHGRHHRHPHHGPPHGVLHHFREDRTAAENAMREALQAQTSRRNRYVEGHVNNNNNRFDVAEVPQLLKQRFADRTKRNADSQTNWRAAAATNDATTATPATATMTTKCPGDHPLKEHVTTDSRFVCDMCNQRVRRNVKMVGCRKCDFDACWKCASMPKPDATILAAARASHVAHTQAQLAAAAAAAAANRVPEAPAMPVVVRPQARFVGDVTLSDGSVVAPGTAMVKTWRVVNSGKVAWPQGCRVVCVGGDRMMAPFAGVEVPSHPVGSTCDVSVQLRAPTKPGRYVGYWRLITAENQRFGHRFWVDVSVAGSFKDQVAAQVLDPFRQAMDAFGQRSTSTTSSVERPSIRVSSTPPADAVPSTADAAPMATPAAAEANAPEAAAVSEEEEELARVVPTGVVLETPAPALSEPIVVGHDVEAEQALEQVRQSMLATYETQLVQLAELGFFNLEDNCVLLERFHGSVQATVAHLLESNTEA